MQADYVIVGAGSAGCAIAYRLAEAGKNVLIIEHGGSDRGPFIQMPAALSYPMNMKMYDWGLNPTRTASGQPPAGHAAGQGESAGRRRSTG